MCKEVIIIGAGGHGRVVADIVKSCGDKVVGFLDDNISDEKVIGKIEDCVRFKNFLYLIAIGNNKTRKIITEKYCDLSYYTAVHPSAVVSESTVIGDGTVVMPNAVINAGSTIGKHCIINSGAIVEHDDCLDDFVHISPGAVVCGTVNIGKCSHIGAGSVIKNNINIAEDVIIGCGGCVVKNIDCSGTYVGIPANLVKN